MTTTFTESVITAARLESPPKSGGRQRLVADDVGSGHRSFVWEMKTIPHLWKEWAMTPNLNTIDIVVADLQAAIAFYARLGLTFTVDPAYPDHAGCDLPSGLHLMLDTEKFRASAQTKGWNRPSGDPRNFLAFQFDSPADVDAKYGELTEAGHAGVQEPWDAFWGMRYATVTDPDGNGIDLYCPLPAQ